MPTRIRWSHDQLLVTFRLYCRTPFGKLHRHNPEIIELAGALGRTPSAVAMKACNFASLDPVQRARNISALGNVSISDRELWDAFRANPEAVAAEAEAAYERLSLALEGRGSLRCSGVRVTPAPELDLPDGPTEIARTVRARRVQSFFRAAVLASYEYRCALSGVAVQELLNASHIIPWSDDVGRRADPRNGIALNALYDRAFDRGLITFDECLRVVLSPRLQAIDPPIFHRQTLLDLSGRDLRPPHRFAPDPAALAYHRQHVFCDS